MRRRIVITIMPLPAQTHGSGILYPAENLLALNQPSAAQAYFALAYAELSQDTGGVTSDEYR